MGSEMCIRDSLAVGRFIIKVAIPFSVVTSKSDIFAPARIGLLSSEASIAGKSSNLTFH